MATVPPNNIQWNAIKTGAGNNSLVSQLYAGKPTGNTPQNFPGLGGAIPKSQTPPVVAASTAVKNNAAPPASSTVPVQTSPNPTPQPATSLPTSNPPTYSGIVGSLASTAQQGSTPAQTYAAETANAGQQNPAIAQNAKNIADKYAGIIDPALKEAQGQEIGESTTGLFPVGAGNAAAIGNATGAYLQGITSQEEKELEANNQGLTAANQEASALNSAAGQANTGQSNIQSGLNAAGSLAAPESYGLLNQPYLPLSDTYGGGGATGAIGRATQAGDIQAAQSNAQAVGTAPVNAQLGVYNTQLQNLGESQVASSQIAAFGDQLLNTMSQSPANGGLGINPSSSQAANATINQLKTQFNDPQYATFNTNIAGLQARISNLLQTGEIPTAATAGAQAIVNGNATLPAMQATLNQIQQEAGAITGSQAQVASTAYKQAQQSSHPSGFTQGQVAGGGDIVWDGSKWVPK